MRVSPPALTLFFLACPLLQSVAVADLMAGSTSSLAVADQMVRLTPGSPLGPGEPEFGLSATGSFTFGWDAEAGGTADFSSFSASFYELHPVLGPYSLAATGTGPGSGFSGQLTNIVDAGGSLVSADFSVSTTFSLTLLGAPGTPVLYTKDQGTFTGVVDGNGSVGNVFTSLGDLDVFLSQGNIATDPLAAVSFNRTVTAVPEPSSFLFCGVIGLLGIRRLARNRKVVTEEIDFI